MGEYHKNGLIELDRPTCMLKINTCAPVGGGDDLQLVIPAVETGPYLLALLQVVRAWCSLQIIPFIAACWACISPLKNRPVLNLPME